MEGNIPACEISGFSVDAKCLIEEDRMILGWGHPCTRIAPGIFKVDEPFRLKISEWRFPPDRFIRCILLKDSMVEYMLTWDGYVSIQNKETSPIRNIGEYFRCVC